MTEIIVQKFGGTSVGSVERIDAVAEIIKETSISKKIQYFSLCSYNYLIDYALENNFFSSSEIDELRKWRNNPINWNR